MNGYSAQLMIRDIRTDYFSSLEAKSFGFFDSSAVGDLLSRATSDLTALEGFLKTWISVLCDAVCSMIAVVIVMYSLNPAMSLLAIIPVIFVFYFYTRLFTQTLPLLGEMQLILGRIGAYILQNIIGMKNVRIFRREKDMSEGFKKVESKYLDDAFLVDKLVAIYFPSVQAILALGIAAIYIYAGNLIVSSILTIGQITLFARYMLGLVAPMRSLSNLIGS